MDKSGLFYRDSTKSTLFKKDTRPYCKGLEQRITVSICASMTDDADVILDNGNGMSFSAS
ncbi:hypothetical protein DPMN_010085, partial [Dreissena polymorpha]